MFDTDTSFDKRYPKPKMTNSNENNCSVDIPDNYENLTVSYFDVIMNFISIILRLVGLGTSIYAAYDYYYLGHVNFMIYTIMCIVIPLIVTTAISMELYAHDNSTNTYSNKRCHYFPKVILIPFIFRFWNVFIYSLKCKIAERNNDKKKQIKYFKLVTHEDGDVAFLRLFDCFLEAASQKVLQIGIYLSCEEDIRYVQIFVIISCFASMAWCMYSYQNCIRLAQSDKKKISTKGRILHIIWNFLLSVSRTISIAVAASVFPLYTLIGCSLHIMIAGSLVYILDRSNFCSRNCCLSYAFSLVLGGVYLFHYIAPREVQTRWRYVAFYLCCAIQNIACLIVYHFYVDKDKNPHYHIYGYIVAVSFVLGLIIQVIYYKYFHPNITAARRSAAVIAVANN